MMVTGLTCHSCNRIQDLWTCNEDKIVVPFEVDDSLLVESHFCKGAIFSAGGYFP